MLNLKVFRYFVVYRVQAIGFCGVFSVDEILNYNFIVLFVMSESEGNSFNENGDDDVVGFVEYINGQNAEIEQADLILEASEGDNCTYSMVCT